MSSRALAVSRSSLLLVTGVLAGSLLMALSAHVAIPLPWSPVPVTGQTLALPLVVALLGTRGAVAAMVVYLLEGAGGLPVFAPNVAGGILGPSGGYLLAFPAAAWVTGRLFDLGMRRLYVTRVVAIAAGTAVVFACGAGWLARYAGFEAAVTLGILPFLLGDALKTLLAAAVTGRTRA